MTRWDEIKREARQKGRYRRMLHYSGLEQLAYIRTIGMPLLTLIDIMKSEHTSGMVAKVEIWSSEKGESEFHDCTIVGTVTSDDRDYRVNIELSNGMEIRECAPECVIQIEKKQEQLKLF